MNHGKLAAQAARPRGRRDQEVPALQGEEEDLRDALPGMQGQRTGEDHGREGEMRTETVLHLENCRDCKGSGRLDTVIICETCALSGMVWRERGAVIAEEER